MYRSNLRIPHSILQDELDTTRFLTLVCCVFHKRNARIWTRGLTKMIRMEKMLQRRLVPRGPSWSGLVSEVVRTGAFSKKGFCCVQSRRATSHGHALGECPRNSADYRYSLQKEKLFGLRKKCCARYSHAILKDNADHPHNVFPHL